VPDAEAFRDLPCASAADGSGAGAHPDAATDRALEAVLLEAAGRHAWWGASAAVHLADTGRELPVLPDHLGAVLRDPASTADPDVRVPDKAAGPVAGTAGAMGYSVAAAPGPASVDVPAADPA